MANSETADPTRNPEPGPEATVRLRVGEPENLPNTQQLDLSKQLDVGSTLKLSIGAPEPGADETRRLALPRLDEPPLRVQKVDQPSEAAGQTLKPPHRPEVSKPLGWEIPLALGFLAILGGSAYLAFSRNSMSPPIPPSVAASTAESVPLAAQATLEQAKAGDVRSMHLLGLMYYNGLNLPRDREKGLYWLRKAAEKGSQAARVELNQIEGGR
jgi:hypothetical protein